MLEFLSSKNIQIQFADVRYSFSALQFYNDSKNAPKSLPVMYDCYLVAGDAWLVSNVITCLSLPLSIRWRHWYHCNC